MAPIPSASACSSMYSALLAHSRRVRPCGMAISRTGYDPASSAACRWSSRVLAESHMTSGSVISVAPTPAARSNRVSAGSGTPHSADPLSIRTCSPAEALWANQSRYGPGPIRCARHMW